MTLKHAFAPVVDAETRVLILGSLPGEASLAAGRYYAHPRNGFWRLVGGVIDRPDLHEAAYEARLAVLRDRGVGLWDVIASARRSGSLDTAVRSPEAADLRALVARLPRLGAVGFNGGLAARMGRRVLGDAAGAALIDLPSSSPAHARPLAEKAAAWARLRPYLSA